MTKEATAIRQAVVHALEKGMVTSDIRKDSTHTTDAVGSFIADYIVANKEVLTVA